jgi:hypothetical protein
MEDIISVIWTAKPRNLNQSHLFQVTERNLGCRPFSRSKLCSQSDMKPDLVVMILKVTILFEIFRHAFTYHSWFASQYHEATTFVTESYILLRNFSCLYSIHTIIQLEGVRGRGGVKWMNEWMWMKWSQDYERSSRSYPIHNFILALILSFIKCSRTQKLWIRIFTEDWLWIIVQYWIQMQISACLSRIKQRPVYVI